MKVAYLLTQSLDSPSGLGRFGPLARAMARLGHQVEIFALHPDYNSLTIKSWRDQDVFINYVAPMHVKKSGSLKSYYPAWKLAPLALYAAWRLNLASLASQADIVHVCKPHPMNSLAGIFAKRIKGKRMFLDCDDYESESSRFSGSWQREGVAFFEKRTPFYAEAITTNTMFMKQVLRDWGISSSVIHYIPNGVELSRFPARTEEELENFKATLDLGGKRIVSFIGTLSLPSHPVDLLLRSFVPIAARLPEAMLMVVGGGEDFETLKTLASELDLNKQVIFTGKVPPDLAGMYYAISEVSVDPVYDNQAGRGRSPLKLFESWACGVPFITADVGDRRALLGEPPAGIVIRPGDEKALAEAILNVLTNQNLADQMRSRGYERVQMFSWDRLAERMEKIYLQKSKESAFMDRLEGPSI
jgi:glycosyltransferase involved in cell wall biosynthesis